MAKEDFNINNILPFAAIGLLVFGASKLANLAEQNPNKYFTAVSML